MKFVMNEDLPYYLSYKHCKGEFAREMASETVMTEAKKPLNNLTHLTGAQTKWFISMAQTFAKLRAEEEEQETGWFGLSEKDTV
ncbi:unnamed protein product [Rodentolepis nana]|uniref:Phage protein n=1 Tax=Rodentolepis nana TaxID=102285 RepID=A0A0R3THR8_RODNA|nr:unnamed protein product [Rodentolepis nana]